MRPPNPERFSDLGRLGRLRSASSILGGQPLENEQLTSVAVCIDPPSTLALRIRAETYETAALPLSYVGQDAGYR